MTSPAISLPATQEQTLPGADNNLAVSQRCMLPALPAALLLWLAYFPIAWGWLGWIALVPLLGLVRVRDCSRWRVYGSAYLVGLAFYVPALQWLRVADYRMYATWILLSLYCSIYLPVAIALLRIIDRRTRLPLVLTLPVVWTALEYVRSFLAGGFAWYLLCHTQHSYLPVIQISDVAGAWGVTFLVAGVNALAFEVLDARAWFRGLWGRADESPRWSRMALLVQAIVVLPWLALAIGYGTWQMRRDTAYRGPRVALVQSNLPQSARNEPGEAKRVVRHNEFLGDLAASMNPDLIVTPETSFPPFEDLAPDIPDAVLSEDGRKLRELSRKFGMHYARRWRTDALLGVNSYIVQRDGREKPYNSAVLVDGDGKVRGRYDKIHRVPFGEYVPFREVLPFMDRLAPYDFDYGVAAGAGPVVLNTAGHRFGVLICYEDTDSEVARPYGAGETRVDFLLNISNDGWFKGTSEHEQHLAICRFRALELRRPIARSVNMGISAVVDANGRVLAPEPVTSSSGRPVTPDGSEEIHLWRVAGGARELPESDWAQFKKVPGVLFATLPLDTRTSFYAVWGDWLPWSCWLALVIFLGLAIRQRSDLEHVR